MLRLPPANLRDGEVFVGEFVGLCVRLTLTESRIIVTTRFSGERTIAYEDVSHVEGGWFVGSTVLGESSEAVYGVYFKGNGFEETARVPGAEHAAELIEARMPPRPPIHPDDLYEDDWPPRWS